MLRHNTAARNWTLPIGWRFQSMKPWLPTPSGWRKTGVRLRGIWTRMAKTFWCLESISGIFSLVSSPPLDMRAIPCGCCSLARQVRIMASQPPTPIWNTFGKRMPFSTLELTVRWSLCPENRWACLESVIPIAWLVPFPTFTTTPPITPRRQRSPSVEAMPKPLVISHLRLKMRGCTKV